MFFLQLGFTPTRLTCHTLAEECVVWLLTGDVFDCTTTDCSLHGKMHMWLPELLDLDDVEQMVVLFNERFLATLDHNDLQLPISG